MLAQVAGITARRRRRSRRWSRPLARPGGRSRWTGPGSTGGSASSPSSTPRAPWATTRTSPGSRRSARRGTRSRTARRPGVPAQRAIEWLRALAESFQQADVPKERAELMHAIYERITVAGPASWESGSPRRPTRTDWRWRCPKRLQWRARQDSNLRPSAPEADALSTELQARGPDHSGSRSDAASASMPRAARWLRRRQKPRAAWPRTRRARRSGRTRRRGSHRGRSGR